MKIFTKFGNGYAEIDSLNDVNEFIGLKITALIITILAWIAGFMVGSFIIYFILAHGDKILHFLGETLINLGSQ